MDYTTLRIEKENRIAKVTLNRPERLNAMNVEMRQELLKLCDELEADKDVRAIIITGAGRAFSSGGDVREVLMAAGSLGKGKLDGVLRPINYLALRLMRLEKPLIAAINGIAVGGGFCIATCCDIRLAAENAKMGLLLTSRGLSAADMGATWILPRIIGMARASELLLTDDLMDARKAQEIGFVNKVVPPEKLMDEAITLALKLATRAPLGIRLTKRALLHAYNSDLASHLEFEASLQTFCLTTKDFEEALKSFTEKREPEFKGD